jgi:hypothetical protein
MSARLVTAILIALSVAWESGSAQAVEVLPVFVFAGQSNANGFGIPSQLPAGLRPAQPNVLFDNAYVNATPAWAPLQPPTEPASRYQFGGQYNTDYANGAFGAELTTGRGISSAMGGRQVAEVKFSQGGTSLAVDWNPDTPAGQMLYPSMVSRVNASVAALQSLNPTKTVAIQGFFWMQGESDADGPTYQANLTNLIARVRTDFGNPNLPFIVGQLGAAWTGNAISQAQANVATPGRPTYVHDTALVVTADLPIIFDGMHFNTTGVQRLGDRYAAAYETLAGLPVQSLGVSVSDANLLSGAAVVASSQYNASFVPSAVTDGTAAQQVFADGDNDMRLVVHGFNSQIRQIRIWRDTSDTNRVPAQVTIRSSESDNASLADPFETALVNTIVLGPEAFTDGYATINVAAPAGTRSLFFDFGGVDSNGSHYGARVMEIQAFAAPEPSTSVLLGMGLLGLLVYVWRKQT